MKPPLSKMEHTDPHELTEEKAIELPEDVVEILTNGKNAYIHMDGVLYRVIKDDKYWEELTTAREQGAEEERERIKRCLMPVIDLDTPEQETK
jgi:hypothetical protein